MDDKLIKKLCASNYYDFITNFELQKQYYDFYTNNSKVKNIKSVKRKVSCFIRTQPRWIQKCFKEKFVFVGYRKHISIYFLPNHNIYDIALMPWLDDDTRLSDKNERKRSECIYETLNGSSNVL